MNDLEKCLVRALHAIVRDLSVRGNPDVVQTDIFKVLYPSRYWIFSGRAHREARLRPSTIAAACHYLQALEALEVAVTSCYSIALTGQIIAYAGGLDSSIVTGLRMQERILCGHAWLEVVDGQRTQIINPGSELLSDFQARVRKNPDDMVRAWARHS